MIQVEIKERSSFHVVGKFYTTSLATQEPSNWWKSLKIAAKKLGYQIDIGSYSLQKYPKKYFQEFSPFHSFEYAPAIPTEKGLPIPEEWKKLEIEGGLFAVFVHLGSSETFPQTMGLFFNDWLPQSNYELDDRIHFCFMPPGYQLQDATATEEIWIPIRLK